MSRIESCNLIKMVIKTNQELPKITSTSCSGIYTYDENDKAKLWSVCAECSSFKEEIERRL